MCINDTLLVVIVQKCTKKSTDSNGMSMNIKKTTHLK